jgi:hypothetical protein
MTFSNMGALFITLYRSGLIEKQLQWLQKLEQPALVFRCGRLLYLLLVLYAVDRYLTAYSLGKIYTEMCLLFCPL